MIQANELPDYESIGAAARRLAGSLEATGREINRILEQERRQRRFEKTIALTVSILIILTLLLR